MATQRTAHDDRGATLIFFALIVTGLLAISGLVVDGGFLYAERRQQQNASDTAAMAGARALDQVQRGKEGSVMAVWEAVEHSALANGSDESEITCTLVDETGQPISGDSTCPRPAVPGADPQLRLERATGVEVTTGATKDTTFLAVLGVADFRAPGTATATLQVLRSMLDGTAPFSVCGASPGDLRELMEEQNGGEWNRPPGLEKKDTFDTPIIVRAGDEWVINAAAIYDPAATYDPVTNPAPSYEIHGPSVALCGVGSSKFHGRVDPNGKTRDRWVPIDEGVQAGPTRSVTAPYTATVLGASKVACSNGDLHDCILVLPICSHSDGKSTMHCPVFGAFYVDGDANSHTAFLLGDAAVVVDGVGGGKPQPHEARLIRLYE